MNTRATSFNKNAGSRSRAALRKWWVSGLVRGGGQSLGRPASTSPIRRARAPIGDVQSILAEVQETDQQRDGDPDGSRGRRAFVDFAETIHGARARAR